jgi:hypothetical protein
MGSEAELSKYEVLFRKSGKSVLASFHKLVAVIGRSIGVKSVNAYTHTSKSMDNFLSVAAVERRGVMHCIHVVIEVRGHGIEIFVNFLRAFIRQQVCIAR